MTEEKKFQTTGLKGLYERIEFFSAIQQRDVFDVTTFIDCVGDNLASTRVRLCSRTTKLLLIGEDQSDTEFLNHISKYGGNISSKKEIDSIKMMYIPERNTVSKIGTGYRAIGNMIMSNMRAESFVNTQQDLMPYQFIEIMLNNSAIMLDTKKRKGEIK